MATLADATATKPTGGRSTMGDRAVRFGVVTFSNSYTTGGEAVTLANLGFKIGLDFIHIEPVVVGGTSYRFIYDRPNSKVIVYNAGTGAEIANATNLSGVSAQYMAVGK